MLSPIVSPYSTGQHPRRCRVCQREFFGLGILCPVHLAEHARKRAAELQAERERSAAIIAAREAQVMPLVRQEIPDELDA